MAEESKRTPTRNIVLFGQTGAGKSSIINMLAGSHIAGASGGASGGTPSNQQYSISHRDGNSYTFWDTPGLNESEVGTMSAKDAVNNLMNLIKEHGVNLLVYCIRGRLVDIVGVNYELVWKFICMEKVPIVLVVTGLEGQDMDSWWGENQKTFERFKIKPIGHACITSWKGRNNINEQQYKESAKKVWTLVTKHCGPIWHMPSDWHGQLEGYAKRNEYNVGSGNWIWKFLQQLVRLCSLGKMEIST